MIVFTYKHKATAHIPQQYLDVVVYDSIKDKEIYTDHLRNGSIEWIDQQTFKANYTPGNPEAHKSYYYFFNIETLVKSTQAPQEK
jgi:flagellar basal body rod protein FlgC